MIGMLNEKTLEIKTLAYHWGVAYRTRPLWKSWGSVKKVEYN